MDNFDILKCGLSNHFHFVQHPKQMSCGHSFCKNCLKTISAIGIQCLICKKTNEIDSTKLDESPITKKFIEIQITGICLSAEKEFEKCLDRIRESVSNVMSQTDAKIKYAKEEIELRVESLKCELDLLNDNLQAKLDNLKSKLTKNIAEIAIEKHEQILADYKETVKVEKNRTEKVLYEDQNVFIKLAERIESLKEYKIEVNFEPNKKVEDVFDESLIGVLDIEHNLIINEPEIKHEVDQKEAIEKQENNASVQSERPHPLQSSTKSSTNPKRFSGETNLELIEYLRSIKVIKSDKVQDTMLKVDRRFYAPKDPYMDSPQAIAPNINLSAPHMHAHALELLKDHLIKGNKALDVGCGAGYLTACMAVLCGSTGQVIGIENNSKIIRLARENVKQDECFQGEMCAPAFFPSNPTNGCVMESPFNAIHLGGALTEIPQTLIDQLANGGRLIGPIGEGENQKYVQIDKSVTGTISRKELFSVRFRQLN